ncbi:MAG: hypothetical protein KF712_03040 [Akkermansiaceae bacterium]|nr:hypothetical protein [Akkermansiaceae bacterium]
MMKDDQASTEECHAVFVGEGGEDYEREHAMGVFEKGRTYRVTGKVLYRWCTLLEIDGVAGEWNPRLFKVDLSRVPQRKEFGYPPLIRVTDRRGSWVMLGIVVFLLALLLWGWRAR